MAFVVVRVSNVLTSAPSGACGLGCACVSGLPPRAADADSLGVVAAGVMMMGCGDRSFDLGPIGSLRCLTTIFAFTSFGVHEVVRI